MSCPQELIKSEVVITPACSHTSLLDEAEIDACVIASLALHKGLLEGEKRDFC